MSSSISVAVRVRPPTEKERGLLAPAASSSSGVFGDGCLSTPSVRRIPIRRSPAHDRSRTSAAILASHRTSASLRPIIKVLDQRVLIFDPPESNPLQQAQRQILARFGESRKVKDMRFCFDRVFDETASQEDVYEGSAKELVAGVLDGYNATVFAYGATGCGKTHTISGSPETPGIVYLLMRDLFERMEDKRDEMVVEVSISYLEIYNETIRDLLSPTSPPLNLREVNSSVSVPGLSAESPTNASEVVRLISTGNAHRTVHGTDANAVSSRSHAVLSVNVRRKPRTEGLSEDWTVATLSVIDLAGSERASVTRNKGDRLLEGANINRSLLALGNCINALCDPRKRGHVPYRDSKLTRLLKHSLGGNCRTLMIVCVAPTSAHYDETHNTLQYANRAKEIKTKAMRNIVSVDRHVSQYVQVIYQLQEELAQRKSEDEERMERAKREWEKARGEVDTAIAKAKGHWQEAMGKVLPAAKAKGELRALQGAAGVLSTWRSAAFPQGSALPSWASQPLDSVLSEISTRSAATASLAPTGDNARSMYEALVASLARSVEARSGASGSAVFDRAIRGGRDGWGLEGQGDRLVHGAEKQGEGESRAWAVAKIAAVLGSIAIRAAKEVARAEGERAREDLSKLSDRLGSATQAAFAALASPVSETATSRNFASPDHAPGSTSAPIVSNGRAAGNRSPVGFVDSQQACSSTVSTGGKATPPPPSPPRTRAYFTRPLSPRRQTSLPTRSTAQSGILKSQNGVINGKGGKSGVRWKDEMGEGMDLEEFDETKIASSQDSRDDMSAEVSLLSLLPQRTSPGSFAEPSAALAAPAGGSRMRPGFLARTRASRAGALQSVGEEAEDGFPAASTSTSTTAAHAALYRAPLVDAGNLSLPSAPVSGLPTPSKRAEAAGPVSRAAAGRRTSSIGPIRSAKPSRRLSLTKRDSLGGLAAGSSGGSQAPPAGPRRSPRKLSSSAMRRTSLAGTGLGGLGGGMRARRVSAAPAPSSLVGAGGGPPKPEAKLPMWR